ncbi:flagellar hook capping protein [Sulfuricurvum sp. IAE1]|jgi:flagellar basal-body rod modification protein FlgD|uniref:flagellar hook capping FlgD N-terminal domain-containing protein n=1 Tax=Sulfuricurvum sp. IAE1 TaxID=2546102 RepID=UPI00104E9D76|nr:flagellar hook capping FlgD N-terminal domain-containing protein [Sulfuricurvum sp. IAE1]MDD3770762.1 flagellar hook capping FlgD N-terminal domain-containing protein [Sulfuricurvum sp.]MDX9965855.1 flagellar hook capping FlgD N-terminal domain-containing protein [Sulfuricurvum sp.]TDA68449.1 flagellar hook capping protein [Sulfuricurvum sp. IAE1]
MAIDAFGNYTNGVAYADNSAKAAPEDKSKLGKDDFLKLLLLELQYQDPTSPMDTEQILQQTSQLATLEASQNTNDSLEKLASALTASMQYTGLSAIGKLADTGSNAVVLEEGEDATFELYFPVDIMGGKFNILDSAGNIVKSVPIDETSKGIAQYTWDGTDNSGVVKDAGIYYVEAPYTAADGTTGTSRVGIYPIQSIRYEDGTTYAKLGSNYVDFSKIVEVTDI